MEKALSVETIKYCLLNFKESIQCDRLLKDSRTQSFLEAEKEVIDREIDTLETFKINSASDAARRASEAYEAQVSHFWNLDDELLGTKIALAGIEFSNNCLVWRHSPNRHVVDQGCKQKQTALQLKQTELEKAIEQAIITLDERDVEKSAKEKIKDGEYNKLAKAQEESIELQKVLDKLSEHLEVLEAEGEEEGEPIEFIEIESDDLKETEPVTSGVDEEYVY